MDPSRPALDFDGVEDDGSANSADDYSQTIPRQSCLVGAQIAPLLFCIPRLGRRLVHIEDMGGMDPPISPPYIGH